MYKIQFISLDKKYIINIGQSENKDEVLELLKSFCDNQNINIMYFRIRKLSNEKFWVDVGSHTNFFYINKFK